MITMRAKMRVGNITKNIDESEYLYFHAVCKSECYPEDGTDENNSFARWTPSAGLRMLVQNPNLWGQFNIGDEFYLDFTKV